MLERVQLANEIRYVVNMVLLSLGVPLWLLIAISGHWLVASVLWTIGCGIFFSLERWTANRIRDYLIAIGEPLPEWLQRPCWRTRRIVLPVHAQ